MCVHSSRFSRHGRLQIVPTHMCWEVGLLDCMQPAAVGSSSVQTAEVQRGQGCPTKPDAITGYCKHFRQAERCQGCRFHCQPPHRLWRNAGLGRGAELVVCNEYGPARLRVLLNPKNSAAVCCEPSVNNSTAGLFDQRCRASLSPAAPLGVPVP